MKFVLGSFILLVAIVALLVLYQNRAHPKIPETLIAVSSAIALALIFVFEAEPIKREISPVYFISNKEKKVFFPNYQVLRNYFINQNILIGKYEEQLKTPGKEQPTVPLETINHRGQE